MKIQLNQVKKLRASAMIVVTIFAVLVSSTLAAYLLMVQNEYTQVGRSQTWNSSMVLAEAGMEEGLAVINMNATNYGQSFTLLTNWTASAAANGWTDLNGNQSVFYKTRANMDGNGGSYQVWVTNAMTISGGASVNITNPIVVAVGVAKWNLGVASAHGPMFALATLVGNSQSQVTREVYVQTYFSPLFSGALTAVGDINFMGNNVTVDSFDSGDPSHSTWNAALGYGIYNTATRKSNGNVSTDGSITGVISVQNSDIYGRVNTGPGGTASIGANGTVGDIGYTGPYAGADHIEPGWSSDDMNVIFPDVNLPPATYTLTGASAITTSGNYQINSMGSLDISAPGPTPVNVTLYLPNGFSYNGNKALNIGTNCNVIIYSGGPVSTSGNGAINNLTQNALSLQFYGLPGCTSISLGGNAAFTGTIYAPEAAFTFGGGGSTTYDFTGAAVVGSSSMNGHTNFHYDEKLANRGPGRGFIPSAWKEIIAH